MPEFRFRRKKQQNRRKTVHDVEEAAKQIETATKNFELTGKPEKRSSVGSIQPHPPEVGATGQEEQEVPPPIPPKVNRSSLVQEREKFFELLRSKYPEQASNLDMMTNGDQIVKTNGHDVDPVLDQEMEFDSRHGIMKTTSASALFTNTVEESIPPTNSFDECLFLRYGKSVRHCPMPSPVTMSTIKNLYRNLFDLRDELLESPSFSIYVRGRGSRDWKKIENISMVVDHCTLLLLEPGHAPSHTPSPPTDSDINTPLNLSAPTTQNSQSSQPNTSVESGSRSSVEDKEATPTTGQGLKRNGLWRAGRSKEVEDLTRVPDNLPVHKTAPITSPLSLTSSTSGVSSEPALDTKKMSERTRSLQSQVTSMKAEFKKLRSDHISKMSEFSFVMNQTSSQISAALRAFSKVGGVGTGGEEFRRERIELYSEEESYQQTSSETFSELKLLETAVEEMRVDVVDRRCGVSEQEVDSLIHDVSTLSKAVNQLKDRYIPLEGKIKRVMEQELQTVVREEKYIQEEGPRVSEAVEVCSKLNQTLKVLMQFATVQSHRTPLVPYFPAIQNPDRNTLLENIQAVIPNHTHRMKCLQRAETLFKKKKQLNSPLKAKLKEFETQLRVKRDHLSHIEISTIEKQQELKLRANFMEEKYKQEKELAKELETERKLALQKREQKKKQMEELWRWQQRAKVDEEKARQMKSIQRVMEGAGNMSGSNRSISSSKGSGHHARSSSDDRSLAPQQSLSQSSENSQSHHQQQPLVPPSKGKRFRKKDHLQPWQRKSFGYVGEFNELFTTIADEVQTSNQASHPLTTNAKSSNQNPAHKSHDHQSTAPANKIESFKPHEQLSNQPKPVKVTLGPKVEIKEVVGNLQPQQFQTTPPFKHPSKQSQPTKTVGQIRPSPPTSKRVSIPSRYSQYEHSSQPDTDSVGSFPSKKDYKSSINSLSQTSGEAIFSHMQPMLPLPEGHKKRATIGATRFRDQTNPHLQMKRSNSDDSLYDSSTLERRKKQGLSGTPYKAKQKGDLSPSHNRKWAMGILNRDTLRVEHRQAHFNSRQVNKGHMRNNSGSSGSSGGQSAKVMGQNSQRYPYHMTKELHQRHAPNCPAHGHNLPLRPTKSAQVPTDSPLTSYPRHLASANHALQMRSASNGMPAKRSAGRITNYPGHMIGERSHVTQQRRKADNDSLGSLV